MKYLSYVVAAVALLGLSGFELVQIGPTSRSPRRVFSRVTLGTPASAATALNRQERVRYMRTYPG